MKITSGVGANSAPEPPPHFAPSAADLPASVEYPSEIIPMMQVPAASPGSSQIRQFLSVLFGGKPENALILVWRLKGKRSYWFADLNQAASLIDRLAGEDVYVGVALSPSDFGPDARCKAEDTAGLVALWSDLDVLSEAHKKTNLPPTFEAARRLIPDDLPPTIVLDSGHGLQAWWAFREPLVFTGNGDRDEAAELARRLEALLKQRAAVRQWDVDSVADLARVLRVPGTTNTKVAGEHRPVRLVEFNEYRYDLSNLREYLDEANVFAPDKPKNVKSSAKTNAASTLTLDREANPPIDKFEALKANEPRFELSWEHRRADIKDQSPSAYDQSLANFAAIAKWSQQEIVNLLIAHRRKHGVDLKLREDYYRLTISLAGAAAEKYWAEQEADEVLQSVIAGREPDGSSTEADEGAAPGDEPNAEGAANAELPGPHRPSGSAGANPERRHEILKALSTKFKIPVQRVIKYSGDPGHYRLETALGAVQLGTVDGLISQSKLRRSLADATGRYLPHFDETWPKLAQALLEACETVDRGEDATLKGMMAERVSAYLSERPPHANFDDAQESREPFLHEGGTYIFVAGFDQYLQNRRGEYIDRQKLTADLRACGAAPKTFYAAINGKETSRSAWALFPGPWTPVPITP